jgi:hypothetical protein
MTLAQAKTAKDCTAEWRADKANFQAKGITERAYVDQCRAGTAATTAPSFPPPVSPAPTANAPSPPTGQEKTAKACVEEWRADKANFQAKGITERAYVEQCRAGTAVTTAPSFPPPVSPAPTANAPSLPTGQQKTAKACIEEWRADKANFQAKGITERAYVDQCRAGTAVTTAPSFPPPASPTATTTAPGFPPASAPTRNAPSSAPPAPRPTANAPTEAPYGATQRGPSIGSPAGAGQFATEAQAKFACATDTVVWVNLHSKIYHFAGTHNYGNTKDGAYMCERDTTAQGMRAAKNEQHP